jgi:acetyl-CoA C-acetyltransferase
MTNARSSKRPCIIGVAQRTVRKEEGPSPEPLDLWESVARSAVSDAQAQGDLLSAVQSLRVVFCESWAYDAPARRLADRLEINPADCYDSGIGGSTPQILLHTAGEAMIRGELDVAMICGAEALATIQAIHQAGDTPGWSYPAESRPDRYIPDAVEQSVGLNSHGAPFLASILENERRAKLGVSYEEYLHGLGDLLSGMTDVASQNPYAWFRRSQDARALITTGPTNRQVTVPYTKHMVAMWNVDMAAAIIVATDEAADRLGVPQDRRVYLHGWCEANDPARIAVRPSMSSSPAMIAASQEALRMATVGMDDIRHLDIYSCFTGAMNLARDALKVQDRPGDHVTVTGGLPYSGGPGSNYMMHSIASMTTVLREDPGSFGMVTGTGMSFNKQAFAVYSARPPVEVPTPPNSVQGRLDDMPCYELAESFVGTGRVASFSVQFDRSGTPATGVAVLDIADRVRAYARVDHPDVLLYAVKGDLVNQLVEVVEESNISVVKQVC